MTVQEKLQEVLDWAGVSQQKLAQLTGLSKTTINGYIKGNRKLTVDAITKIAEALQVSPWIFLNGEPLPVTAQDMTEAELRHMWEYRMLTEVEREATDGVIRAYNIRKRRRE